MAITSWIIKRVRRRLLSLLFVSADDCSKAGALVSNVCRWRTPVKDVLGTKSPSFFNTKPIECLKCCDLLLWSWWRFLFMVCRLAPSHLCRQWCVFFGGTTMILSFPLCESPCSCSRTGAGESSNNNDPTCWRISKGSRKCSSSLATTAMSYR